MAWRNSPTRFGLVTRLLHWGMALALLAMLAFGTRIAGMEPGLANLWMYGLHKSIGLLLLALVVLRLIWHRISPPPRPAGRAWRLGEPACAGRACGALSAASCHSPVRLGGKLGLGP